MGGHSPSSLASMYLSSPVGVRPGYSKTMKPLRTVREEHQGRDTNGNRPNMHKVRKELCESHSVKKTPIGTYICK